MNRIAIYQNGIQRAVYAAKTIKEILRMIEHCGYIGIKSDNITVNPGDKITGHNLGKF